MKDCEKEFYQLTIKGHIKDTKERFLRYINGLRLAIQDEIELLSMYSINEVYQYSVNA